MLHRLRAANRVEPASSTNAFKPPHFVTGHKPVAEKMPGRFHQVPVGGIPRFRGKFLSIYCSYHPSNPARVGCTNCRRPLCSYCDHRIKGYPYCQDCIVLGIENLSRSGQNRTRSKKRARVAALCGLIPGLGAAYNHQNLKAVMHFVGVMLLFQLSEIGPLELFFALAGTAFYLYSIIDAYRTGDRIASGEDPQIEEKRLRKGLVKRAKEIGVLLLAFGVLALIRLVHPFGLGVSLIKMLPVMLILLGGYLIVRHLRRSQEEDPVVHSPQAPYPLIPFSPEREKARRYRAASFSSIDTPDSQR